MRVIEIGVRKMAKLIELEDPKPSWGAVLQKVEKYALRTDYDKLPPKIQPHIGLLRDLLPRMQAVQHAWRNTISHVEDKIVPVDARITEEVANEIMNATQGTHA